MLHQFGVIRIVLDHQNSDGACGHFYLPLDLLYRQVGAIILESAGEKPGKCALDDSPRDVHPL
jgi:hypothetical protein